MTFVEVCPRSTTTVISFSSALRRSRRSNGLNVASGSGSMWSGLRPTSLQHGNVAVDGLAGGGQENHLLAGVVALADLAGTEIVKLIRGEVVSETLLRLPPDGFFHLGRRHHRQADVLDHQVLAGQTGNDSIAGEVALLEHLPDSLNDLLTPRLAASRPSRRQPPMAAGANRHVRAHGLQLEHPYAVGPDIQRDRPALLGNQKFQHALILFQLPVKLTG